MSLSQYNGANIQLLDLPGIIEGASQGKGRGRQVISVARTADIVLMMLDATKGEIQRWAGLWIYRRGKQKKLQLIIDVSKYWYTCIALAIVVYTYTNNRLSLVSPILSL